MPAFEYEASNSEGAKMTGFLEADSPADARNMLRDMALIPIDVVPAADSASPLRQANPFFSRPQSKIGRETLAILTRQLATLLDSGLVLDDCLNAVSKQSSKPTKRVLSDLRAGVREGQALATTMERHPKTFSPLYVASVVAGETSGNLSLVMNHLANYLERRSSSDKQIAVALIYPILLSVISFSVVAGLMIWVIPDLVEVITSAGQELPALTKGLIGLSDFLSRYALFSGILLVASWLAFRALLLNTVVKSRVDAFSLNIPFVGRLLKEVSSSRYCGTLGILTTSGIPLASAMSIANSVTTNAAISEKLTTLAQQVREGGQFSTTMESSRLFNELVIQLVSAGEHSGQLAPMLQRAAEIQDDFLQRKMATFTALFEPLILIFMGVIVMVIVLAIMMPILNLNQLVQ